MTRRLPGILLVLALAAAPAYAQTTTTTGTPTTSTTTLGSGCVRDDPALCRINLRLEAFRETVEDASASLGRLFDPIRFRLQRSDRCLLRATVLCDGRVDADRKRAREKLQQCVRPLAVVLAKIRSNYARRVIPPDLAEMLASETGGLASDLKAARESLTCP